MFIDVVILSYTVDVNFYNLTKQTIETLIASEPDIDFRICIVETNSKYQENGFIYENCKVVCPNESFNYNRFLNIGLSQYQDISDWVLILNNDLNFCQKNWLKNILKVHREHPEILSFSPFEPVWHTTFKKIPTEEDFYLGYTTGAHLTGWCLLIRNDVLKIIGPFDEKFTFWYQDRDYSEMLKKHNIKHALVTTSHVRHLHSQSRRLLKNQYDMTKGLLKTFEEKWHES